MADLESSEAKGSVASNAAGGTAGVELEVRGPVRGRGADDEVNLADLLRALRRQSRVMVLSIVLCTALLAILSFVMTPVYRVETLLAPVVQDESSALTGVASQLGGLAALAGIDIDAGGNRKAEAVALLQSRNFTQEFIAENDLLPILFSNEWDPENEKWLNEEPGNEPTLWKAYDLFDSKVRTVKEDAVSGLVTLSVEWKDPDLAVNWTRQLVGKINQAMRQRAVREAEASLAYLNQALGETNVVEVREAIFGLMEAQVKSAMLANVREEYAFRVLDPPVRPDDDEYVRPNRPLMAAVGAVLGLFIGLVVALVRDSSGR